MTDTKYIHASRKYYPDMMLFYANASPIYHGFRTRYTQTSSENHYEHDPLALSQKSFDRLVYDWTQAIRYSSSLDEIVNEANYLTIIGYGESALPFIFDDLRKSPKAWFVALRKITGENPIPKDRSGSFKDMIECWLNWADKNGY